MIKRNLLCASEHNITSLTLRPFINTTCLRLIVSRVCDVRLEQIRTGRQDGNIFYLTTHSTHFILRLYGVGHMVKDHSDSERGTRCRHMGYSFRLTARVILYASSHRQDTTYHGLCYTSRGSLVGTRNSSIGPPHEGSIRRPTTPRAKALTTELHLAPQIRTDAYVKYINMLLFSQAYLYFHILYE